MLSTVRISTLQPSTVFCFICNGVEQSCKSQSEAAPICYRSPTMLREGNVFSHVCLSDCPQGGTYVITHGSVQTCSLEDPPPKKNPQAPLYLFKLVHGDLAQYSATHIGTSLSPVSAPVQTCLNLFTMLPIHLLASRRLAFQSKAFLLICVSVRWV